jgi:hypothetical protein
MRRLREELGRFREWFRRSMLSLHARDKERGGWLHRFTVPVSILFFLSMGIYWISVYYGLISAQWLMYFTIAYIAITSLWSAIILIGLARVWRKPVIYFLVAIVLVSLLGGIIAHFIWPPG